MSINVCDVISMRSIQKSAELMAEIAQLCVFVPGITAASIELTSFATEEVKQHIQQLSEQFRNLTGLWNYDA